MDIAELLYLVLTSPSRGLSLVVARRPLGWALLLVVVYALVNSAAWRRMPQFGMGGDMMSLGFLDSPWRMAIIASIWSLAGLFIMAGIWHLAALALRGNGGYLGLVCGLAFALLPMVFIAPLVFLALLIPGGLVLAFLGNLALNVWVAILDILAIKHNYGLTTSRATAAFFLPLIVFIGLAIVLALVVALGFLAFSPLGR